MVSMRPAPRSSLESCFMSTTQVGRGLEAHGVETSKPAHFNLSAASLYEHAIRRRGRLARRRKVRSSAAPASTPADRPTTSSSSRSRRARSRSGGARSTGRSTPRTSTRCTSDMLALRRGPASCSCRTATPAPIPRTGCRSASSPSYAWHSLFARNMFIDVPTPTELPAHTPEFTVIDAPSFKADPARHGTQLRGRSSLLNFAQEAGAHRRHELRRRDQEVDLHRDELPAAAAQRAVDALLGQRRRRRRRRRCSSACRAPARRRCRAIPSAG